MTTAWFFLRLNARGKVFIEYLPAEKAWAPVVAPNQMYINCFWVSGSYKKQGHGAALLAQCVADAKAAGMQGVSVLSAAKKKPFLSDGAYLKRKGFVVADTSETGYELLWLPLAEGAQPPQFHTGGKTGADRFAGPCAVLHRAVPAHRILCTAAGAACGAAGGAGNGV